MILSLMAVAGGRKKRSLGIFIGYRLVVGVANHGCPQPWDDLGLLRFASGVCSTSVTTDMVKDTGMMLEIASRRDEQESLGR